MFKKDVLNLAKFIGTDSGVPRSVADGVAKEVKNRRTESGVNLNKNWDFYQGFQTKYFKSRVNESVADLQGRKDRGQVINLAKLIVDTNTKFLYSRSEEIGRTYGDDDVTKDRLKNINDLINISKYQMDSKRNASIFGESITRLVPVDEFSGQIVKGRATVSTYPHPVQMDPKCTYVLRDAMDNIQAVVISDSYTDYVENQEIATLELIVPDSRWYWEDDALISSEPNSYALQEEFVLQVNNTFRKDDLTSTLNLQTKLNETVSDNVFFFERHGRPQLVSSVDLGNVVHGDGKVWNVNLDDEEHIDVLKRLGYLVWDGKMEQAMDHAKRLEQQILKLSYVAQISTGDIESTGQLRTGAALVTSYGPTIKLAQESKVIWAINEEKLNLAIAKMDARIHGQSLDVRFPTYDFKINFPRDAGVPGEELVSAEITAMSLNSHAITFREHIKNTHSDFTDAQVEDYYEEIMADSRDIADATRAFESKQVEAEGKPIDSSQSKSSEQSSQKA